MSEDGGPRRMSIARMRRAYEAMENLPKEVIRIRDQQQVLHQEMLGEIKALRFELSIVRRSQDMQYRQVTLPDASLWNGVLAGAEGSPPGAPWGDLVFPNSTLCRQESLEEPVFAYWMKRLGEQPAYHRKQWEFAFICQVLWERELLRTGARGLGFGVGEEPLSALFAAHGCEIVGSDQSFETAVETGWTHTEQHAAGKEALRHPTICPNERFDAGVSFQSVDMNAIPSNLEGFDFCWSACALEHLGTIDQGLDFIENSLATLKPGGLAVHTTELNLTSDHDTIHAGPTVLFRKQDLLRLADRLQERGHHVTPFDWTLGDKPLDRYVDVPPYLREPHVKLMFDGYVVTSVGMIVRKAGGF